MEPNESDELSDQRFIEEFIKQHAKKIEKTEQEHKGLRILVMGEVSTDPHLLRRLHEHSAERGLDLIIHTVEDVNRPYKHKDRRAVALDSGRESLAAILAQALKCLSYEDFPVESAPVLEQPLAMPFNLKAKAPSFRQFQNNQRNHGPPARRQFAQIRPPRRGNR